MKINIRIFLLTMILSLSFMTSSVFANPAVEETGADIDISEGLQEEAIDSSIDESTEDIDEESIDTDVREPGLFADVVRVGLKYGSSAVSSYTLTSVTGFYVADIVEGVVIENLPISAYTSVSLSYEGGVVVLRGDDGNVLLQDFGASVLLPINYADGGTITVNSNPYRGGIAVTKNSSGTLNLINILNTEHYVYGVLDSEMYHNNPIEALKAQAVAARSFAKINANRHSTYGFDLCIGTHCQVYKGYSDEHEETNMAVDETAGLCLYYDNKPVSAYYFKNSGGYTQNIKDVWGSSSGYLKAVKDIYSPEYPWTVSYTFDALEEKLSNAGKGVGSLISVDIISRNESGAVDTLQFTGTSGTTTLSREKIRTFFGSTVVKSTMFSFAGAEAESTENVEKTDADSGNEVEVNGELAVLGANGTILSIPSNTVSVIGAAGTVSNLDLSNAHITNGYDMVDALVYFHDVSDEEEENKNGDNGIVSVSESATSSPVTFVGVGYGHGIGMPQDSAIEMAKQGFAFDEILKYYYTDIEIK